MLRRAPTALDLHWRCIVSGQTRGDKECPLNVFTNYGFLFAVVVVKVQIQRCFTPTETIMTIRDGEPRTATSTFTQLLSSDRVWREGAGKRGLGRVSALQESGNRPQNEITDEGDRTLWKPGGGEVGGAHWSREVKLREKYLHSWKLSSPGPKTQHRKNKNKNKTLQIYIYEVVCGFLYIYILRWPVMCLY